MATPIALPAIKRSPATLQYRIPATRPAKFYKPAFRLTQDDRVKTISADWFRTTDPLMPPYPYGADVRFREANEGLYGGMSIQSGNKISKGRNEGKTLRKWFPNVKVERIKSEALGKELTIPIAARVMRTIKKCGGLDEYLTGPKPARVKELGLLGWKLRWMVVNSDKWRARFNDASNTTVGASKEENHNPLDETFEQAWADEDTRAMLVEKQAEKWEELREKDEKFKRHFMKNIVADRSKLKIPDLSTLSFYDPMVLQLASAEVVEGGRTKHNDPANSVRR